VAKTGVRDLRGVSAHEPGGGRLLIAVSIKQRFCGRSPQDRYWQAGTIDHRDQMNSSLWGIRHADDGRSERPSPPRAIQQHAFQ
jgi:hypothetical protein